MTTTMLTNAQGLELAIRAYAEAETEQGKTEAFEAIQQWLAEDDDAADDADLVAYAQMILRNRGLWHD